MPDPVRASVLEQCRAHLPGWAELTVDDVDLVAPQGFSSFTGAVKPRRPVEPAAVFYRRLAGKENAILDFGLEKRVFLDLGEAGVAAACLAYTADFRLEAFYEGETLRPEDLRDDDTLRQIAEQLHRLHSLRPAGLPPESFFELLHRRWAPLGAAVLEDPSGFPPEERPLFGELKALLSEETRARVRRCLPVEPLTFCHNDTYHGNIMRLASGDIRLLDFEFSCLGHRAYDFSNLFAETVMVHGLDDYPHFRVDEPSYGEAELRQLIRHYVACDPPASPGSRPERTKRLLDQSRQCLPLSHYVYAMAALPLARDPIQRIRFIPYAHARFQAFLRATG